MGISLEVTCRHRSQNCSTWAFNSGIQMQPLELIHAICSTAPFPLLCPITCTCLSKAPLGSSQLLLLSFLLSLSPTHSPTGTQSCFSQKCFHHSPLQGDSVLAPRQYLTHCKMFIFNEFTLCYSCSHPSLAFFLKFFTWE